MKIFVAVPVYDSKLPIEVVQRLLSEQLSAIVCGDEISFHFVTGNAGITQARNQLATEFLDSDCDRLFFLDADITWDPGALVQLAHKPADLVGGCYRYKRADESYPMRFLPGPRQWNDDHLIEVEMLPTGFLAISRRVFETMLEKKPEIANRLQSDHKAHCFFQMPLVDGALFGEDFYFCKTWRELGGKVFLDPMIELTHWGFAPTAYKGHIGHWLKRREGIPIMGETAAIAPQTQSEAKPPQEAGMERITA